MTMTLTCIKDGRSGQPDDDYCQPEEVAPLWKLTPPDRLDSSGKSSMAD